MRPGKVKRRSSLKKFTKMNAKVIFYLDNFFINNSRQFSNCKKIVNHKVLKCNFLYAALHRDYLVFLDVRVVTFFTNLGISGITSNSSLLELPRYKTKQICRKALFYCSWEHMNEPCTYYNRLNSILTQHSYFFAHVIWQDFFELFL